MAKIKDKKKKTKKTKDGGDMEYPDKSNPFESTEKLKKNGKDSKSKETETNPFLMKPTKSMKKREKVAKKEQKKEQKREKKKQKKKSKDTKSDLNATDPNNAPSAPNEGSSNASNSNKTNPFETSRQIGTIGSYDPPVRHTDTEPLFSRDAIVSRTLDGRSPTRNEHPSPILPNKRILELKTEREASTNQNASLPDLTQKTHYQYRPNQTNSAQTVQVAGKMGPRNTSSLPGATKQRPASLEVQSHNYQNKLSPVKENRSPSPLIPRHQTEMGDVKMYRTASISKKGRDKKKKKKLKLRLKKKKKGKAKDVIEDQAATQQVVMRKPRTDVETLRKQVEEVKESARTSIINLVEQRNSALDRLTANTAQLEEFAHGFATVAQEARLKNQARATCCGIGSKYRICWYICACQGKLKRKKRRQKENEKGGPEAVELLDDDDDYYRPANTQKTDTKIVIETPEEAEANPSMQKSNTLATSPTRDGGIELKGQSNPLKGKLLKMPKALRASLPSLADDTPPPRSLRSMADIDPRERKSSSVNALHEIVKKRGAREREERLKREKLKEEERDKLPPLNQSLSYMANIEPRQRKSSSVSALNEIKKTRAEKRREEKEKREKNQQREKFEKDIDKFASQYDDEDTRKKVTELLRLDLT